MISKEKERKIRKACREIEEEALKVVKELGKTPDLYPILKARFEQFRRLKLEEIKRLILEEIEAQVIAGWEEAEKQWQSLQAKQSKLTAKT